MSESNGATIGPKAAECLEFRADADKLVSSPAFVEALASLEQAEKDNNLMALSHLDSMRLTEAFGARAMARSYGLARERMLLAVDQKKEELSVEARAETNAGKSDGGSPDSANRGGGKAPAGKSADEDSADDGEREVPGLPRRRRYPRP